MTSNDPRHGYPIPRLPLALLRALLSRAERDEVLVDVADEYAERVAGEGRAAARRWLWRQALGSVPPLIWWSWWRGWNGFEQRANANRRGGPMLMSWIADVRYAGRRLRARPAYAMLAVLTLALGVGGTAAVYGIAHGLLFDPLPYAHERELGVFWEKSDWTEEEFLHLRGQFPGFREVALYRARDMILREGDAPARLIPGISASAELFDVLGARPMVGRAFREGDDAEGAEPVAVLSYGLWQELGGDQDILGRRLTLQGTPRMVVGVMPRGFWFPDPSVRIWMPEPLDPAVQLWNSTLIGRVGPGHDVHAMTAPIAQLLTMLEERFDYPPDRDKTKGAHITPLRDDIVGGMRPALLATLGAVALILLIACANVAALMLGQVEARSTELVVRSALGASRRQLTQQLVVEAMLIAAAAGLLGTLLAWGGFPVLVRALPLGAWTEATTPDWTVFASAMAIAVVATLLVVFVPTMSLWRGDLRGALSTARTGGLEGRGGRLENGLVVAQVALAVLIVSGAALLMRSVANLYAVDAGVRTEGVGVVDVTMGLSRLERRRQTIDQLTAALSELPGVRSAAAVQTLPLRGGEYGVTISVPGRSVPEGMSTEYRMVTPGYLETMGMTLLDGRTITETDRGETEPVVVINEALAKEYFASTDPIGRRVGDFSRDGNIPLVVGVVANAAESRLTDGPEPVRYAPVSQMPFMDDPLSLVIQAAPGADLAIVLDAARRTVQRVAPGFAVQGTTTMRRVLDAAVGPARQVMLLLSLLSGLALALGAVGVYGVIAHFATRRRRDWAIRIALGLTGSGVIAHVVRHGALLVTAGIGIGALAATALARLLASLLYGVSAADPLAFGAAGAVLLAVSLFAAFIPAWRVAMTDPMIMLREQ